MKAQPELQNKSRLMKTKNPCYGEQQTNPETIRPAIRFQGGWLYGTVVGVEPSRHLLFLRTQETRKQETRKQEIIHLVPETQFSVDSHAGSSSDLRSGQRVRIHCRIANDKLAADNIAIEPSDYSGTPMPKVIPLHPEPRLNQGRKMP